MKRLKPIESLILTIRGPKVLVDADLASRWKPAPSIRKKVDKYIKDTYLKKVQAPQGRETNAKSMDGAFVICRVRMAKRSNGERWTIN